MGAWGHGPFENDSAHDWLVASEDIEAEAAVCGAFDSVEDLDYVEVDEGSAVVAAATMVAAAMRGEGPRRPAGAARMTASLRPTAELRELAVRALDIVLGEGSELAELWGEASEWREETVKLRDALERG